MGHDRAGRRKRQYGGYRGDETRLVTSFLKNPASGGVGFRVCGEGMEVERLLSILLKKCLLRARRLSFRAGTVSIG